MKYAAKADRNQPEIVAALRSIGARVVPTHTVGQGFPDLVVAIGSRTILIEIKDGQKVKSKRRLTPQQEEFHAAWTGEIYVVETIEEALAVAKGESKCS
jgi:Holliday junction resolvase